MFRVVFPSLRSGGSGLLRSLGPTFQRRYLHSSRPPYWSRTLWSRADGSPRSKLRGAMTLFILIGMANVAVSWSTHEKHLPFLYENTTLTSLTNIRRIDSEQYSSVDFSSYLSSSDYYSLLTQCYPATKFDSFRPLLTFLEEADKMNEARSIMRTAAEQVHDILKAHKDHIWDTDTDESRKLSGEIMLVLMEAEYELMKILGAIVDDIKATILRLHLENMRTNAADKGEDPKMVG
ncbi:hypothetical protein R3P38DRAFT_814348 [Favolaschia claudopus]|uniref:Uncharacterized protein n=1 Tax=Favolaschia claudopus TaxID=2862362 RepID=A0AAW0BYI0_9AGAR